MNLGYESLFPRTSAKSTRRFYFQQYDPANGGDPPPRRSINWFSIGAVTCAGTAVIAVAIDTGNIVAGLTAGAFVLNLAKMLRG